LQLQLLVAVDVLHAVGAHREFLRWFSGP